MNGAGFIALAGTLAAATSPHSEARYRTAVSRAYYGVFHRAVELLDSVGATVKANHQGHREAINLLLASKVQDAIDAARILDDLHSARIKADYRMKDKRFLSANNALLAVEDAHNAIASLEKCLIEPNRSQLAAFFRDSN